MSNKNYMAYGDAETILSGYSTAIKNRTIQYSTMPTASSRIEGKVVQYVGSTTSTYINGYFYECVNDGGSYTWVEKAVQSGSGSGGHVIEDASGTALTQRGTMQFSGYLKATDNSTDEVTEVSDEPTEVSWATWLTMTSAQKQGTKWIITGVPGFSGPVIASDILYSNTTSGLLATTVQAAIDEVVSKLCTVVTGTITAGNTSITLTNSAIRTTSMIDGYFEGTVCNPKSVVVADGSITITIDAQQTDLNVAIRVLNLINTQ